MFLLFNNGHCADTFPNVHVALRIYLYMMASNFMGERSFFLLERIKNKLGNTMGQHKAAALSLMSIEDDNFFAIFILHSRDSEHSTFIRLY